MAAVASLKEIAELIGFHLEEAVNYLDTETGEAVTIAREVLCAVEDGEDEEEEDVPGWQDEEWETAREILGTNRYVRLPDCAEIPEWRWMSEFAGTMAKPGQREELWRALSGPKAYRRFRSAVRDLGVERAWFAHRDAALCGRVAERARHRVERVRSKTSV